MVSSHDGIRQHVARATTRTGGDLAAAARLRRTGETTPSVRCGPSPTVVLCGLSGVFAAFAEPLSLDGHLPALLVRAVIGRT